MKASDLSASGGLVQDSGKMPFKLRNRDDSVKRVFGFVALAAYYRKNVHSAGGLKTGQNWSAVEYKAISG